MFPTFFGEVCKNKLIIPELDRREKFLEGKHLAIVALQLNQDKCIVGGELLAGVYENGDLKTLTEKGDALKKFEGRQVMVIVRHDLMGRISPNVFDERFQLGAKLGDVDN